MSQTQDSRRGSPGVNAAITALSISGLPSDRFLFVGFLPPKRAARLRFFSDHLSFPYTIILYESCHRIEKMLQDLVETLGPDRCISVSRELTKLHETSHSGPAAAVQQAVIHSSLKESSSSSLLKKTINFNPLGHSRSDTQVIGFLS